MRRGGTRSDILSQFDAQRRRGVPLGQVGGREKPLRGQAGKQGEYLREGGGRGALLLGGVTEPPEGGCGTLPRPAFCFNMADMGHAVADVQ